MKTQITAELLTAAVGCSSAAAQLYAQPLAEACGVYGIESPARLAAFLAQIGHESGSFRHAVEIWGPTAAQRQYEGRVSLGNTQPGDGRRYCGRGLIQTTGRFNYRNLTERLRRRMGVSVPDFEAVPELLEQPRWAALSAADYWDRCGLNTLADAGDFERITLLINGGMNGQPDRLARWHRATAALAACETSAPTRANSFPSTPPAPASADAYRQEGNMPIPALLQPFVQAAVVESIPKLARVFSSGSNVAERNIKGLEIVADTIVAATGASNVQEAVERIKSDPAALQAATQAVESRWLDITEAGAGGIEGARKADQAARQAGDMTGSPSFWVGVMLLPLVYMIVGNMIGLIGTATWSDDVRAGLAGSIISAIIGGLVGYYYGQTTSRNRTPPQ